MLLCLETVRFSLGVFMNRQFVIEKIRGDVDIGLRI